MGFSVWVLGDHAFCAIPLQLRHWLMSVANLRFVAPILRCECGLLWLLRQNCYYRGRLGAIDNWFRRSSILKVKGEHFLFSIVLCWILKQHSTSMSCVSSYMAFSTKEPYFGKAA